MIYFYRQNGTHNLLKNGDVAFVSASYKEVVQGWYKSCEFPGLGTKPFCQTWIYKRVQRDIHII